jgi:hypothetical protein
MMSTSPPQGEARGNLRLQKIILRLMALVALPVLPAVFAPRLTVEKLSWTLGFGEPPHVTLIYYVAAGGSLVYLLSSGLFWMLSCDVLRYRPLVIFVAVASIAVAPIFGWLDADLGMPRWWMLMDALSCLVGGTLLLWALWVPGRR